jgi:hypothetical protein
MKTVLALLLVGFLAGCSSVQPYDGVKRAPKEQIDVFSDGQQPTKPFKVIASFSEEGGDGDQANKYAKFVKQAKQLGADGIILKPAQKGGFGWGPFGGGSRSSFTASAIVYQ